MMIGRHFSRLRCGTAAVLLFLCFYPAFSQKPPSKFGDVTLEDLNIKACPFDSAAQAYYLFDFGKIYLDVISTKGYELVFTRHLRIVILGKDGVDLANQAISLYVPSRNDEFVQKLKAVSYNLENGKIVETEMEKSAVFKEKTNNVQRTLKFTVPNVRVGTVFEVQYEVHSDYIFSIPVWTVQHDHPVKRSEYHVKILRDFVYRSDIRGYMNIDYKKEDGPIRRLPLGSGFVDMLEDIQHFTANNVPAFRTEPFLYTDDNYRSTIRFDLARVDPRAGYPIEIAGSWGIVVDRLLDRDDFGDVLKKKSPFRDQAETLKKIRQPTQRIRAAFEMVRNHYSWNGNDDLFPDFSPAKAYETRTIGSADINFALIGLLREIDIDANPVIFNTRDEGQIRPGHVGLNHINKVIVAAEVDSTMYYMDPSDQHSAVNLLPPNDCNGFAILIKNDKFRNVDLKQNKVYNFHEETDATLTSEGQIKASVHLKYGDYGGYVRRRLLQQKGSEDAYFKYWAGLNPGLEITKHTVTGLDSTDIGLLVKLEATFSNNVEQAGNLTLVNPWLLNHENENPFKSETRDYPVEFDFPIVRASTVRFTVPDGYVVESLPKGMRARMLEGAAKFTTTAVQKDNIITVNTLFQLSRTTFLPDEYAELRHFYQTVINKQQEKIVLKKKS
jgi:Domain of Unknown Function with PDB structure (DUF3857)